MRIKVWSSRALLLALIPLSGCGGESDNRDGGAQTAQSCMTCHNGSPDRNDYSGPGLENPHPFPGANQLLCTACHGGNPNGEDELTSHVPPPPQIGDRAFQITNRFAFFNRLTLTGLDRLPDYTVNGTTYTALDYLQFVNPGDLRVTQNGRSCGQCHQTHSQDVANSLLATSAGIFGGATYSIGVDNQVAASQGLHQDTAADLSFRALADVTPGAAIGAVSRLLEYPVKSVFNQTGPDLIHGNNDYDATQLANDLLPDNRALTDSKLANLYHEQVAFTCGDCHLGSAGANNRAGDFRSSGCTACHMPYSLGGRSGSGDPNVNAFEPLDPDDIEPGERPHVRRHLVTSVAQTLPSGEFVQGIDDMACAGCHQGSNRTVMQFWGIRLDQNQDVRNNRQYPANPTSYQNTSGDTRLFDPVVDNNTFNGRNRNQYLAFEDYDGDGRDDTPPDVHHEAGMGCIDCHGSGDLHGGDTAVPGANIYSRMEQAVAIRCESCHGDANGYAPTASGQTYDGQPAQLAMDANGEPLRHVFRDGSGDYWLRSRLTGNLHYVKQTLDTIVDNGRTEPGGAPVFNVLASYAMGRADGNPSTGLGPQQDGGVTPGFSHGDNMTCVACHSSWTNNCIGCHLEGEYSTNPNNFSNITGQRISFRERNADFVYQSPVMFQLGVGPRNKITPIAPNTETFFEYRDNQGRDSQEFSFSDRNGHGNDPFVVGGPSLSHNAMMPHSIRGRVDNLNEGPRYCVACHLTDDALTTYGADYDAFRTALRTSNYGALNFPQLQQHIGRNPGNRLNSPFWVHMVAGLGSGLFLFDEQGCPTNELDTFGNRIGCDQAPATNFNPANVAFNLDRIVDESGASTGSNAHPLLETGPNLRDGGSNAAMSGPLGATLIERLADPVNGIVLDSWIDADGASGGQADDFVGGP